MSNTILYFPHIHLLRVFAAITVILFHVIPLKPWADFPRNTFPWQWFSHGWMAVDIFFVISGFVIMLTVQSEMAKGEGARKRFLIKRAFRILPLYFLTLFVDLFIRQPEFMNDPDFWYHFWAHVFMLHNWSVVAHDSINGPNWTLAFEMQFYLLVWLLLPYIVRMRWQVLLLCCLASTVLWRLGVYYIVGGQGHGIDFRFIYAVQVPGTLDELGFGMVLAKLVYTNHPFYRYLLRNPVRNSVLLFILSILILLAANVLYWSHHHDYWDVWYVIVFLRMGLAASFVVLIAALVVMPFPTKPPTLLRTGYFLGEMSYGIYLWHMIVLRMLIPTQMQSDLLFTAQVLVISILLAVASFYTFERPAIRYARRLIQQKGL